MSTPFASFIQEKKIDPRRILAASAKIEGLRPEDRAIRLKKRLARKDEAKKKDATIGKPRSGRPVTQRALDALVHGKALSGPSKTRVLRAVNHILEQKKQEPATLQTLFGKSKAA